MRSSGSYRRHSANHGGFLSTWVSFAVIDRLFFSITKKITSFRSKNVRKRTMAENLEQNDRHVSVRKKHTAFNCNNCKATAVGFAVSAAFNCVRNKTRALPIDSLKTGNNATRVLENCLESRR